MRTWTPRAPQSLRTPGGPLQGRPFHQREEQREGPRGTSGIYNAGAWKVTGASARAPSATDYARAGLVQAPGTKDLDLGAGRSPNQAQTNPTMNDQVRNPQNRGATIKFKTGTSKGGAPTKSSRTTAQHTSRPNKWPTPAQPGTHQGRDCPHLASLLLLKYGVVAWCSILKLKPWSWML